jgi:hypothetical protein
MRTLHCVLCSILVIAACGDDDVPNVPPSPTQPPIVLDDQVVFVDGTQKQAFVLDLSAAQPKAASKRLTLPPQASAAVRRNEHNEALVLCAGEREEETSDAAPASLVVIAGTGEQRTYELGSTAFNALTQSDDGRYAIAYRDGTTMGGRTLDNPNELAVVDLDRGVDEAGAVTGKTPAGLAHTLTRVLVSPTMTIADEERRLLVLLSAAEVSVFDLNHLERRATIVQLDERRNVDPVQVLFSTSQPTLYVRAASSDNIFMFRFEPFSNTPDGNDFQPSINPLSSSGIPKDIALFGSGSAERLLVVANLSALVIDPATSKTSAVRLQAAADRVLLFEGRSPRDENTQARALLYSTTENRLTFFDLEATVDAPSDSVELVSAEQKLLGLIPLIEGDDMSVVLLQESQVTIIDLQTRTLTPFATSTRLTDALFDPVRKKLWVGPSGNQYIQSLDLLSGRTGDELRLDAPISSLLPMFQRDRLIALHADSYGHLTLVDATQPDREHTFALREYFGD